MKIPVLGQRLFELRGAIPLFSLDPMVIEYTSFANQGTTVKNGLLVLSPNHFYLRFHSFPALRSPFPILSSACVTSITFVYSFVTVRGVRERNPGLRSNPKDLIWIMPA
jgi:hypothetical protein